MKTIHDYPHQVKFELPPVLDSKARCAIDTEWFGMDKKRLHRPILPDGSPNGTFACATFCFDGETVYFITDPDDVQQAMDNVSKSIWIFANAKFDITHLRRHSIIQQRLTKLWDVIAVDQIMWSGYYDSFTLGDIARRRLGVYMPKEIRNRFEDATELDDELIEYSAFDPIANWHVYQDQRDVISKTDLALWKDVDLPAMWTLLSMSGILVDNAAWMSIYKINKEILDGVQACWPDINLRSSKQVGEKLVEDGYRKLPKTDTGKPKTDATTLANIKDPNQFVQDKLKFSSVSTLVSTFGEKFLAKAVESDGRVYADFRSLGAGTGRMSCAKPNLQNIPKGAHRDCFVAAEGNVLIVGDWSSQEPRIFAYLSQDQKLIDIFNAGKDIYIEVGRMLFGWELTKDDPRRSKRMKPTVLGAAYGLTEHGMEREYGIPKKEGRELLDAFFDTFTDASDWINEQRKGHDYVTTIRGRKFWLNHYTYKALNNAINSPVQGTASDSMKLAAHCFVEQWKANPIVNLVHDEIVAEVHESAKDSAIECLRKCMLDVGNATHPGIKADCDIGWGKTWASKV